MTKWLTNVYIRKSSSSRCSRSKRKCFPTQASSWIINKYNLGVQNCDSESLLSVTHVVLSKLFLPAKEVIEGERTTRACDLQLSVHERIRWCVIISAWQESHAITQLQLHNSHGTMHIDARDVLQF